MTYIRKMEVYPLDSSNWDYGVYDVDTEETEFGAFQPFVRLWNSKRVHGKLPAWKDFELEDFSGWYGWISVCDVTLDGLFDTHYRLWGTNVVKTLGYDMSGKSPRLNATPPYEYEGAIARRRSIIWNG